MEGVAGVRTGIGQCVFQYVETAGCFVICPNRFKATNQQQRCEEQEQKERKKKMNMISDTSSFRVRIPPFRVYKSQVQTKQEPDIQFGHDLFQYVAIQ